MVEPLAIYTGTLECMNNFDYREEGGVPAGKVVVWPDRLEMSGRGLLKAAFRPRAVAKERVRLVRPLLASHPLHQVVAEVHPLARGLQLINFVVSVPKDQPINTGNIHYLLGIRSPGAAEVLAVLEAAGFPVTRTPVRVSRSSIFGALSELDLKEKHRRG